jgi:hypothetical protein
MKVDVHDPECSLMLAIMCQYVDAPGGTDAIVSLYRNSFGSGNLIWFRQGADFHLPALMIIKGDGPNIIIWGGSSSPTHGIVLAATAGDEENTLRSEFRGPTVFVTPAESLHRRIGFDSLINEERETLITGHSYGGAIAAWIGILWNLKRGNNRFQLCTFGSPRPGNAKTLKQLSISRCVRYMSDTDVVPFLPPHNDELPFVGVLLNFVATGFQSEQEQFPIGTVVHKGGETEDRMYPSSTPVVREKTIGDSVKILIEAALSSHLMHQYVALMRERFLLTPEGQAQIALALAVPVVDGPQRFPTLVSIEELSHMAQFFVPPDMLAVMVLQRKGVYQLQWQSFTIAQGSRSAIKILRNRLNSYLRRLQHVSEFPIRKNADAWAAYVALAGSADPRFVPPLPTT